MHILGEKNFLDHIESSKLMVNYSASYTQFSIYNRLISFVYGQRFTWLKEINRSTHITVEKRDSSSKQTAAIKFLTFTEIWSIRAASISRKMRLSISLFPYKFQLY